MFDFTVKERVPTTQGGRQLHTTLALAFVSSYALHKFLLLQFQSSSTINRLSSITSNIAFKYVAEYHKPEYYLEVARRKVGNGRNSY